MGIQSAFQAMLANRPFALRLRQISSAIGEAAQSIHLFFQNIIFLKKLPYILTTDILEVY